MSPHLGNYCFIAWLKLHMETIENTYEHLFREQTISRFVKWVPEKISVN